ncbi:hypothetical protein AB0B89_31020 [Sphaerisporangium sp. NPDC049002]|uniref:hypothetical protein n=1 Tax=Sphaerisporangium sp. NPDC049002 TaxID=3155392 RepID=UPI00340E8742
MTGPWMPAIGARVTWDGHDGVWVVEGYDGDAVWLYQPGESGQPRLVGLRQIRPAPATP